MDKIKSWGKDELMVIAAFRYCLGRMTYIVRDCVEWLMLIWVELSRKTRLIIYRDLTEAFEQDDRERNRGAQYRALGQECDRAEWQKLLDFINEQEGIDDEKPSN